MGKVRDEELADVAYVMADPRGRRFIYRLLEIYGLYQSTLVRTPLNNYIPNEYLLVYNGARQEIAQAIRNEVLACDGRGSLYQQMMTEAQEKKVKDAIEEGRKQAEETRRRKEQGDDDSGDAGTAG